MERVHMCVKLKCKKKRINEIYNIKKIIQQRIHTQSGQKKMKKDKIWSKTY